MEEWFLLFLGRLSLERLCLELEYITNQWHVCLLRNEKDVLRLMHGQDVADIESWKKALNVLEARLDSLRCKLGLPLCIEGARSLTTGSKLRRLPDTVLHHIAEYLDATSVLCLGESCKQAYFCMAFEEVWKWRPLNLAYIKTLSQWKKALKRGLKSVHWNCATHVVAPKANASRIARELTSFFKGRLKVLDLTSTAYISLIDYDYFLRMRHEVVEERPQIVLLPTPSPLESRLDHFTRHTLAKHIASKVFFDFCR
jgi:hypothetical protein